MISDRPPRYCPVRPAQPHPTTKPTSAASAPVEMQTRDITIGVELEMVLFNLPSAKMEIPYGDLEFVANTLKGLATRLQTIPMICGPLAIELQCLKSQDISVEGLERREHPELNFQIKYDCSVSRAHASTPDLFGQAVEVATPILGNKDWTWVIPSMCEYIILACQKDGATVSFNNTCGLHVHIGVGRDYTLGELKRISKAIVLFEPQMDMHHPEHRRPQPSENIGMFHPCRMSLGLRGLSTIDMMKKIDEQSTITELLLLVNGSLQNPGSYSRFYRYNLTCALTYKTIEFRQAAGTIDGRWIVDWIDNIIRFITSAVETSDEMFSQWAGGVTDRETCARFGLPDI